MKNCKHQFIFVEKTMKPLGFKQPVNATGDLSFVQEFPVYQEMYRFCCPHCKKIVDMEGNKVIC